MTLVLLVSRRTLGRAVLESLGFSFAKLGKINTVKQIGTDEWELASLNISGTQKRCDFLFNCSISSLTPQEFVQSV